MNKVSEGVVVGSGVVKKIEEVEDELLGRDRREEGLREFESYGKRFSRVY